MGVNGLSVGGIHHSRDTNNLQGQLLGVSFFEGTLLGSCTRKTKGKPAILGALF